MVDRRGNAPLLHPCQGDLKLYFVVENQNFNFVHCLFCVSFVKLR